jgi:Transcriptional regulator PadR-like family
MDELEAIKAYQSGRADAFAVLFELHAAHVYRTSYLITRDVGRAEDIARGGGYPVPREGTLLPLLHRLEVEGLLDTRWRPGPQGLRRSYALSARGRRVRRWVWLTWRLVDLRAQLGRLVPRHVPMAR